MDMEQVPVIDLRSDTVTRPDAEMRRAMAEAEVGDDVYGEDPTVARLEAEGAAAVGQEAAGFDSVMFCLSKGLGAPVGSLLCGGRGFVAEARRVRKLFGGGMRQVGVLAAAGLVALRKGPARLAEDHANAALLAAAVAELPGAEVDLAAVRTNIVVLRLTPRLFGEGREAAPAEGLVGGFLARLRSVGVLASEVSHDQARMVTHRDAGRAQVEEAIARLRRLFGGSARGAAAAPATAAAAAG
jgi:threonine aldolase